jgi:hypothetical protein
MVKTATEQVTVRTLRWDTFTNEAPPGGPLWDGCHRIFGIAKLSVMVE